MTRRALGLRYPDHQVRHRIGRPVLEQGGSPCNGWSPSARRTGASGKCVAWSGGYHNLCSRPAIVLGSVGGDPRVPWTASLPPAACVSRPAPGPQPRSTITPRSGRLVRWAASTSCIGAPLQPALPRSRCGRPVDGHIACCCWRLYGWPDQPPRCAISSAACRAIRLWPPACPVRVVSAWRGRQRWVRCLPIRWWWAAGRCGRIRLRRCRRLPWGGASSRGIR
jgi:hypothetical protein